MRWARLLAALLALPCAGAAGDLPEQEFVRVTIPVDGSVGEARVINARLAEFEDIVRANGKEYAVKV